MPIAAIFSAFFLHYSQLFMEGALCHGPTLADPLQKSHRDSKKKCIFLENTMFLGQKLDKTGTDSK